MTQYLYQENIVFALANLHQLVFEVTDACKLNMSYSKYRNDIWFIGKNNFEYFGFY